MYTVLIGSASPAGANQGSYGWRTEEHLIVMEIESEKKADNALN